jgi:RNA polymerase sigma-70 factor (ECF subfamily)
MSFLKKIFSAEDAVLNERSYEELFRKWYAPLCKMIFRLLKDKELTEDTVQDVFIKLWEKRAELKIQISLKSYLYRAAINAAYNHLEKNKRYSKLTLEDVAVTTFAHNTAEADLYGQELETKIKETLLLLPEACREVFVLSRFEELSYKEIAETLGISIKTVENQMGKALRIFREQLKGRF